MRRAQGRGGSWAMTLTTSPWELWACSLTSLLFRITHSQTWEQFYHEDSLENPSYYRERDPRREAQSEEQTSASTTHISSGVLQQDTHHLPLQPTDNSPLFPSFSSLSSMLLPNMPCKMGRRANGQRSKPYAQKS